MKATFQMENPGVMECTMTITLRLNEWEKLNEQLQSSYPSWQLSSLIEQALKSASNSYYGKKDYE